MKKPTSKPAKADQKLTSFFTRRPSNSQSLSQQSATATRSSPASTSTLQSSPAKATAPDPEVISISSGSTDHSHISISSDSVVLLPAAPRRTLKPDMPPPQRRVASLAVPGPSNVLKRSRSPSIQFVAGPHSQSQSTKPTPAHRPQTPKRKKKFEAAPAEELTRDDTVVIVSPHRNVTPHHTRVARNPPRATQSIMSVMSMSSPDDAEVLTVPSSQSDEHELVAPNPAPIKKSTSDIKASVHRWREGAAPDPPPPASHSSPSHDNDNDNGAWDMDIDAGVHLDLDADADIPMVVDDDVPYSSDASSSRPHSRSSEAEVVADLAHTHSGDTSTTPTTPASPIPTLAPAVALDQASKTAALIARIKAEAAQAVGSSPEERPIVLRDLDDLDDDSSDDEIAMTSFKRVDKGKGKSVDTHAMDEDNPFAPPSPSAGASSPDGSHRRISTRPPARLQKIAQPAPKPQRKKAVANPLDALLRDKRRAEQRGQGPAALSAAEHAMAVDDFADEEAARRVVAAGGLEAQAELELELELANANLAGAGKIEKEEAAGAMGLKPKDGARVQAILEKDRRAGAAPKKPVKVLGVALWEHASAADGDVGMGVQFPGVDKQGVEGLLANAWEAGDLGTVALIIDSGGVDPQRAVPLIPTLIQIACSGRDLTSGELAFRLLTEHLWRHPSPVIPAISSSFCAALACLGASPAALARTGLPLSTAVNECKYASDRAVGVHRLVHLARMSSRCGALGDRDTPGVVMALLLIGMDPFSGEELKFDVTMSVHEICAGLKGDDTEREIFGTILRFAKGLLPINQALVVSILSGGSGRVTYIAMWLAHGLLTHDDSLATMHDGTLPPLSNIITLLSPAPGSGGLFDILTRPELVDYENLGYYLEIISVALSRVPEYAAQFKADHGAGAGVLDSPSKAAAKMGDLDKVENAMISIHDKIVDTRAAHLERSRAKAALQRLQLRVRYQRMAAGRSEKRGGKKIGDFFAPKS